MQLQSITGLEDPLTLAKKLNANFAAVLNLASPIPFRPGVPLWGGAFCFPAQTLSAAIAFTPEPGAQAGGSCFVQLTSDGLHVPVFAGGFQQASGAAGGQGWSNVAGAVNSVRFWFDGTYAWYGVN